MRLVKLDRDFRGLIFVGARGHRPVAALLLGSVALWLHQRWDMSGRGRARSG